MAQSAQIKSIKAWHGELIDFMLAQPRAGLRETSEYFGVSQSWLSIVKNSDAFQNEWDKRRAEHSSAVSVSLVERVEALAEVAIETMTERLEREGQSVGLTTLREISESALKSLGFGMKPNHGSSQTAQTINNNHMIVVDKETLARAREARVRMQLNADVPSLELAPESESTEIVEISATPKQKSLPLDRAETPVADKESESEGGGVPPGRVMPPPDSVPPLMRTSKEAKKIFHDLFGSDTNKGD